MTPAVGDDYQGAQLHPRYTPLPGGRYWIYTCERCGHVGKSEGPWRVVNNYRAHRRRCAVAR